jgi:hypothetical protein
LKKNQQSLELEDMACFVYRGGASLHAAHDTTQRSRGYRELLASRKRGSRGSVVTGRPRKRPFASGRSNTDISFLNGMCRNMSKFAPIISGAVFSTKSRKELTVTSDTCQSNNNFPVSDERSPEPGQSCHLDPRQIATHRFEAIRRKPPYTTRSPIPKVRI